MDILAWVTDDAQAQRLADLGARRIDDLDALRRDWPRLLVMDEAVAADHLGTLRSDPATRRLPVIVLGRHAAANACIEDTPDALASMMRFWGEVNLPPRPE